MNDKPAKLLEANVDFLHDAQTCTYIMYAGDIRFVKKRFGFELHKDFQFLNPEENPAKNLNKKFSKKISKLSRKLKKGRQFLYNPDFEPEFMSGLGIVAGNMNKIPWTLETLELMLAQPEIEGLIFDGLDKRIIYHKNGGEIVLWKV